MRPLVVGLLLPIVLAGCQRPATDGQADTPRYQSVGEVRNALDKSGLGCADFQTIPGHHRDFGEEDAVDIGACLVDNREAVISMWSSLRNKQDWIRQRAGLGCQLAGDLSSSPPIYVDGGFWTVRVNSRRLADSVSRAIGGEPKATDCRSAWIDTDS